MKRPLKITLNTLAEVLSILLFFGYALLMMISSLALVRRNVLKRQKSFWDMKSADSIRFWIMI